VRLITNFIVFGLILIAAIATMNTYAYATCEEAFKEWNKKDGQAAFAQGTNGCVWGNGYPTLAKARDAVLADCKASYKNCKIRATIDNYTKLTDKDLCGGAMTDNRISFSELDSVDELAEVKKRKLDLGLCRKMFGLAADPLDEFKDKTNAYVCTEALNYNRDGWLEAQYAPLAASVLAIKVVQLRNLSIKDCQNALVDEFEPSSDEVVCAKAISDEKCAAAGTCSPWSHTPEFNVGVEVARRGGYAPDDCFAILTRRERVDWPDKSICVSALNENRDNWNANPTTRAHPDRSESGFPSSAE
jgi:hypothetical protein